MCFTPAISLSTAIIEFILVIFLFILFKKSTLRNFFAIFIFILGFYQFTEFMLCIYSNPFFWARVGFATYSLLPAVALHSVLVFLKKERPILWLYAIPFIAILIAFFHPNFISNVSCNSVFISAKNILVIGGNSLTRLFFSLYVTYYAGFVALVLYLCSRDIRKQKDRNKKGVDLILMIGILLMTIPTFILMSLVPALGGMFPSVLCEFALLVAICVFISAYLNDKSKNRV
ncbi:MAG: hypothetical protein U9Q06_04730 [Nanoarchaeota archaeon]|nr:hypothetical protein [Nanoarchaeota archaeon]